MATVTASTDTTSTSTSEPDQAQAATSSEIEDKGHASTPTEEHFISPTIGLLRCPKHNDQQQNMYCCTCSAAICAECHFTAHSGHEFILLKIKKLQDELDSAVLTLLETTSKCTAHCKVAKGKLHKAEAGKKEELNQLSQMKAIAENGLLTQYKSAVAQLQSDLDIRREELCQAVRKQECKVEDKWRGTIETLKQAIETADNRAEISSAVLDQTRNVAKDASQIQTVISSVQTTGDSIPDLEEQTSVQVPSVSPQSDFAEFSDLSLSVVSSAAKGLALAQRSESPKLESGDEQKCVVSSATKGLALAQRAGNPKLESGDEQKCTTGADTEAVKREQTETTAGYTDPPETLASLLPMTPKGGGEDTVGYVAVAKDVFLAWQKYVRGLTKQNPPAMKWPNYDMPLQWWSRNGSNSEVIFLEPKIAKAICKLVGGTIELTQEVDKGDFDCLEAKDGSLCYVGAGLKDSRGKTDQPLGFWLLPAKLPLLKVITLAVGFEPIRVSSNGRQVDLGTKCAKWRQNTKYGLCLKIEE